MPDEAGPENDMSKELGVPKIEWNQVQKALRAAREGRPVPEIAGGAPTPGEMFDKAKRSFRGEKEFGGFVRVENPKSPESWVVGILSALNNLEDKATREQKALESFPEYQAIEAAIGAVPEKMAGTLDAKASSGLGSDLGKDVYLKEKLELVWAARLRLHNRKTEVVGAGGSLKMLSPSSEVPLGKGVRLEFTPIQPIDLYILVRLDDLFKKEAGGAGKELCPPVEAAMVEWQREGESWDRPHPEQPPRKQNGDEGDKKETSIAKQILNSGQEMMKWRKMIADRVGSTRAEQLAFDLFTISLSFDKWDKKLEGLGPYEPRGLIHFDAKRKKDYWDRLQKAGPETTIGAYFAETNADADDNKELQDKKKKPLDEKDPAYADRAYAEHIIKTREERLRIVRDNRERAVFRYSVQDKPKGQLVGDLWDSLSVAGTKKSFTDLLSEGKNWKDLPYLKLSNSAYAGYFGFALGMASKLEQELTNTTFDPKLLVQPEFWTDKRALINKLAFFSPLVQERKEAGQDKALAEIMRTYVRGVIWTGSHLAQPVSGAAWLEKIWPQRRGYFAYGLVWQIYDAIKTSGVLPAEEIRKLKDEVSSYRFSHPPRRR